MAQVPTLKIDVSDVSSAVVSPDAGVPITITGTSSVTGIAQGGAAPAESTLRVPSGAGIIPSAPLSRPHDIPPSITIDPPGRPVLPGVPIVITGVANAGTT